MARESIDTQGREGGEAGGQPMATKKRWGRRWRAKRDRHGVSWWERKVRSERYCVTKPASTPPARAA
jgi:hypothetical protein